MSEQIKTKKCSCTQKLKEFIEVMNSKYGLMAVKFDIKWQGNYDDKYVLATNNVNWVLLKQSDIESMEKDLVTMVKKDNINYYNETIKPFLDSMPEGDNILGQYMHFKGNTYTVKYGAMYCPHLDTYMNVYVADRDGEWYCREMESFYAPDEKIIHRVENVTGQKERFKKIKTDNK